MTHKNRPRKIINVFRELREVLGEQYPAHEILRVAYRMVEVKAIRPPAEKMFPCRQRYIRHSRHPRERTSSSETAAEPSDA